MWIKSIVATAVAITIVLGGSPTVGYAEETAPGFTTLVRDGITLWYRRLPVSVPASTRGSAARADYDGDLKDDLAIGSDYGMIVRYSSRPHVDQMLNHEYGGSFGPVMTSGDFNADGYDDLVVADPFEADPAAGQVQAGAIWIFPGGPDGLRIEEVRHLNQSSAGIPGASEHIDQFGRGLAAGDITGDKRDDLAIGIPGKRLGKVAETGVVIVLKGGPAGLTTAGTTFIDQASTGVPGTPELRDRFGWAVAIGRINKDAYADLAVSAPGEDETNLTTGSGVITQFWGSAGGVSLAKVTAVNGQQITAAVHTDGTNLWNLGYALGITDTNGDGYGEIISGNGDSQVGDLLTPGTVVSLVGRATGLSVSGVKVFSLNTPGVPGIANHEDHFGQVIAVGDATGDGRGDVLVGVPGKDVGSAADAGAVVLLRGSPAGLTGTGSQMLDQSSSLVPGAAERDDWFGTSVALVNLDGTGPLEAVVGAPQETTTADQDGVPTGTVSIFPTGATGLRRGTDIWGSAVVAPGEKMTRFGFSLATLN